MTATQSRSRMICAETRLGDDNFQPRCAQALARHNDGLQLASRLALAADPGLRGSGRGRGIRNSRYSRSFDRSRYWWLLRRGGPLSQRLAALSFRAGSHWYDGSGPDRSTAMAG